MSLLLNVTDLTVEYPTRFGTFQAVKNLDIRLEQGEIHGLVGESGAGKSTIGQAIMGLIPNPGYIATGDIELNGESIRDLNQSQYHKLRGAKISMIFQDPQTSLNPLLTVEERLVETIRQHSNVSYDDAFSKAVGLLEETGISDAKTRILEYPHQFSGGMRQRVVIALALCTEPDLIIADEPLSSMDMSGQARIIELILDLRENN